MAVVPVIVSAARLAGPLMRGLSFLGRGVGKAIKQPGKIGGTTASRGLGSKMLSGLGKVAKFTLISKIASSMFGDKQQQKIDVDTSSKLSGVAPTESTTPEDALLSSIKDLNSSQQENNTDDIVDDLTPRRLTRTDVGPTSKKFVTYRALNKILTVFASDISDYVQDSFKPVVARLALLDRATQDLAKSTKSLADIIALLVKSQQGAKIEEGSEALYKDKTDEEILDKVRGKKDDSNKTDIVGAVAAIVGSLLAGISAFQNIFENSSEDKSKAPSFTEDELQQLETKITNNSNTVPPGSNNSNNTVDTAVRPAPIRELESNTTQGIQTKITETKAELRSVREERPNKFSFNAQKVKGYSQIEKRQIVKEVQDDLNARASVLEAQAEVAKVNGIPQLSQKYQQAASLLREEAQKNTEILARDTISEQDLMEQGKKLKVSLKNDSSIISFSEKKQLKQQEKPTTMVERGSSPNTGTGAAISKTSAQVRKSAAPEVTSVDVPTVTQPSPGLAKPDAPGPTRLFIPSVTPTETVSGLTF